MAFFLNDIFATLLQRMTRSIFHDIVSDNLEAVLPFHTIPILNRYHLKSQLNEKTILTQTPTNLFLGAAVE